MPDIIALGEPMVELNRPKGEDHYRIGCGGDVSNAMVAAARSGRLDRHGHGGRRRRVRPHPPRPVATRGRRRAAVKIDPAAPTGLYFVSHGEAGHSFSYRREGSAASRYGAEDLPREALEAARILHVSGISQAISTRAADAVFEAMAVARAAGVLLSYDTNIRLKLWPIARARAVIHEAMTNIDIALPGLDDARLLVGVEDPDQIVDRYLSFGARIVALKLGSQGCLVATAGAAPPPAAAPGRGCRRDRRRGHVRWRLPGRIPAQRGPVRRGALRQPAALATRGYGAWTRCHARSVLAARTPQPA